MSKGATVEIFNETPVTNEYFVFPKQNKGFEVPQYLATNDAALVIRPPVVVKTLSEKLSELSAEELEALEALRLKVRAADWFDAKLHDDWTLLRYLRARSFDVAKALKMLSKTAKWYVESSSLSWRCPVCLENPNQHMMQFVGWDLQHRPILYASMRWSADRSDPMRSLVHSVTGFNHALSLMPEGVEQWVSITDFETYSHLSDSNPKMGSTVISVLQDHFPERLGVMILVDPPTMFWVLWKLLCPFIDPKTKDKVKFMYTKSKPQIADEFPKLFPPHVCDYLIRAYMRNKQAQLPDEVLTSPTTQR